MSRSEQEQLEEEIKDVRDQNSKLQIQVNKSSVEAVEQAQQKQEEAEKQARQAENQAERERKQADVEIQRARGKAKVERGGWEKGSFSGIGDIFVSFSFRLFRMEHFRGFIAAYHGANQLVQGICGMV